MERREHQLSISHYNMGKLKHPAQQKKPDIKDHILCEAVYMTRLEEVHLQRQKIGGWSGQ